jgi:uncharacterized protein (TIGR02594 family)
MEWARSLPDHIKGYTADSIPWCGLFAAEVAEAAGWGDQIPDNPLWALNWLQFGDPIATPGLGDVLVWRRPTRRVGDRVTQWGGHVAFYAGEDDTHYYALGGNQGDRANIVRLTKRPSERGVGFRGARQPRWKVARPATAVPVRRTAGSLSAGGSLA